MTPLPPLWDLVPNLAVFLFEPSPDYHMYYSLFNFLVFTKIRFYMSEVWNISEKQNQKFIIKLLYYLNLTITIK